MISGDMAPFKLTVLKMNISDRKKMSATAKEESVTAAGVRQGTSSTELKVRV